MQQAKKVTCIPATLTKFSSAPITQQIKRKVAGYARVSTDEKEQNNSYEAQVSYYTNFIQNPMHLCNYLQHSTFHQYLFLINAQ